MYDKYLSKLKKNKYIALVMVIGTILIAITAFYDSVVKIINPLLNEVDDIIIDVKLASNDDPEVQDLMIEEYFWAFLYKENRDGDKIIIKPDFKYLDDYYQENFVKVQTQVPDESIPSFNAPLPILDVKIINNSEQTIVLDKLLLEVISSITDNRPLIHMHTYEGGWDGLFKLFMVNEGWGEWHELEINFNLHTRPSAKIKFNTNNKYYTYSIKIPFFERTKSIDLSKYLKKEGVLIDHEVYSEADEIELIGQFNYKEKIEFSDHVYYGPYSAIMEGQILLKSSKGKIIQNINFSANIPLTMTDIGGGLDVFRTYNLIFKNEGSNYKLEYPISISLLPNEPERILLVLKADKTTTHKFKIILENINGIDIESKNISLDIFVPKTAHK